jgi:uncharacterized protein YndB with AHSA1/START domain
MTDVTPVAFVSLTLPAAPDIVYDEWLDAEGLMEWMCPRPAYLTKVVLDARVGGSYRFDIHDSGMDLYIVGRYLDLDRPRLLRFTWSCSVWPDPTVESVVTVALEPHGTDETLMTIEHVQLPPDVVDRHEHGWALIAEQLAHLQRKPSH